MTLAQWQAIQAHILELEQEGLVTRTFRRLDPGRQEVIIQAILEEAVERGPTSINIKLVAKRAGVSVGSLYTYFGNREGLLDFAIALSVRFTNELFAQAKTFLTEIPLRDGLRYYFSGGLEWGETQTGLMKFFARAAYHSDSKLTRQVVLPIAETMRGIVHEMLVQAQARGEIREDVDLDATTRIVHALTIAVGDSELFPYLNNYFQVTGGNVTFEHALDAMIDLVLNGIGAENREDQ